MKRISLIVVFISVLGVLLISVWAYEKYFKQEALPLLYFKVEKGRIEEIVKTRGEIVPEKNFDLRLPYSGTIDKVFVREGAIVPAGAPLVSEETTDAELERKQLGDRLRSAEADLSIRKAEAANAMTALDTTTEKERTLVASAYRTLLSDGLSAEAAETGYSVASPAITGRYTGSEGTYRFVLRRKSAIGEDYYLYTFGAESTAKIPVNKTGPTPLGTFGLFVSYPKGSLETYVDKIWEVVIPNTKSANYLSNLNAYEQALKEEQRAITEARAEVVGHDGSTPIALARVLQAEATINDYRSQIALIEERIRKSTLYAPVDARVAKVWVEKGELATPDMIAITLDATGFKAQSDISELEIAKIDERGSQTVTIVVDAFPRMELSGKVLSVEPEEVVKDGDKYYRTNIAILPNDLQLRPGMSADLSIHVSSKDDVIKIPELALSRRDGKTFVTIKEGDAMREVEITTGISDGESIEVTHGLREGQTIAVSAD